MNIDINKEINKLKEFDQIKSILSEAYAEALNIDKKKAAEIVSAKFNRHVGILSDKLQKGITEESLELVKNKEEVSIEEYLEKKPVIKG